MTFNAMIRIVFILGIIFTIPCRASEFALNLSPGEKAWISEQHIVRVRIGHAPPFMFAHGEIKGIAIDYLTQICDRNKIQLKYIGEDEVTWPAALTYIKKHQVVDMVPTAKITPERQKDMLFTDEYIFSPWVIFTRTDSGFVGSLDDLNGKTVSVEEGVVIHQKLKQAYPGIRLKVVPADSENFFEQAVKDVSTGLADAYVGNLLSTTYMIQTRGYTNIKVAAPTPFDNHNQAMAIRNDWPELVGIINKTLAAMTPEEHAAIRNKWLAIRYEHGISAEEGVQWLLGAAGFAGVLVLFVLFWNRRLKREVTVRRKIETALRESRERFERAFENHPDMFVIYDTHLKIRYINGACVRLTGRPEWEFIGRQEEEIWPPQVYSRYLPVLRAALDTGTLQVLETELQFSEGRSNCYLKISYIPLLDTKGNVTEILSITHDLTERKKTRAKRLELEAALTQAQRMESVGRLAGGVAHDYNNALSVIIGFTELAAAEVDPASPLGSDLDEVLLAAKRATDITRQLLAFARKQTISPKVMDLNKHVAIMLKMLQRLIGEDISLAWRPRAELWPVKMDPSQLDQVLANLCVNSRDAISDVGKITIETDTAVFDGDYCSDHHGFVPGEFVTLAVSDNGCGMDKEILDIVFEPFFTTKTPDKGTGLGLSTVYGIVKQNNGFINVYSEKGVGTTIKIYLPRNQGTAAAPREETREEIARGRGETLLIVEDDGAILKLARQILAGLGYTVLTAGTPREAIRLAGEHAGKIHLLVTDVIMPEMNGLELKKCLQSVRPDLKCIFMSGYTANTIAHHGVLDKGVNFIQKPFSKKDLAKRVRSVLDEEKGDTRDSISDS
ncbi:MAG: transporter substrate-binding domain-containing protein [Proteobacteria bacterium]|nr:transporter substrate-binding domain-containing protein [Pseudomonadota bacterium]